jgi:hypothetical protein
LVVCLSLVLAVQPYRVRTAVAALRDRLKGSRGLIRHVGSFLSEDDRHYIAEVATQERPDLVLFDTIFNVVETPPCVESWVLTHDVMHQRIKSFSEQGIDTIPSEFSATDEATILERIGQVIASQHEEAAEFRRLLPQCRVVTVPATMPDVPPPPQKPVPGRCLFVGSASFHNLDGIRWFIEACWPTIHAAVPYATLHVYGSVCLNLSKLPPGVVTHGVVDDLAVAYAEAWTAVVPLRIGSGLKVKIVEAIAHGVPSVTTSIGAQGLGPLSPRPFLVGDTAAEFTEQTIRLLQAPELRISLSRAARSCAAAFRPDVAFAEWARAIEPLRRAREADHTAEDAARPDD